MKRLPVFIALAVCVAGAALLTARQRPAIDLPEGTPLKAEFAMMETDDGAMMIIHNPELHSLTGKVYVVGAALNDGVTNTVADAMFEGSQEWVSLDHLRRFALTDKETLQKARARAAQKGHWHTRPKAR